MTSKNIRTYEVQHYNLTLLTYIKIYKPNFKHFKLSLIDNFWEPDIFVVSSFNKINLAIKNSCILYERIIDVRYVLLDCIKQNMNGYKYYHPTDKLNDNFKILSIMGNVNNIRQFVLLEI